MHLPYRRISQALLASYLLPLIGVVILLPLKARAYVLTRSDSLQVTAFIASEIPTSPAIISSLTGSEHFSNSNLVVRGTCTAYSLVRAYNNGQLAGSIHCSATGTFVLNITLVVGTNQLTALNYNSDDQVGPSSNPVIIYFDEPTAGSFVSKKEDSQSAAGSSTTTEEPNKANEDYQRLFEGTFIEPLAKAMGINPTVSSSSVSTQLVSVAANGVFIVSILLLSILIFL